MIEVLLIVLSLILPGFVIAVTVLKVHRFRLNVSDAMFWGHVFIVLLPATFFLFDDTKEYALNFFLAASIGVLCLPLGLILGGALLPDRRGAVNRFPTDPLNFSPTIVQSTLSVMLALLVLNFFSVMTLAISTGQFPLLALFSGAEVILVKAMRFEAAQESTFINDIVLWVLAPLLFTSAVLFWRNAKKLSTKLFLLVCMILPVMNNSFAGRKTPVATIFLLALIGYLIASNRKRQAFTISPRRLGILLLFLLMIIGYPLLIFLFLPAGLNLSFWELLRVGVFERIFLRPAENSYAAFELFPEQFPFTRFLDVGKFSSLMGQDTVKVSKLVAREWRGVVANSPPASVSVFYLQQGWLGVVVLSTFVAALFKCLENIFLNTFDKTLMTVSLYAFIVNGAVRISWGQYHAVIFTEALLPIIVLAFVISTMKKRALHFHKGPNTTPIQHVT